MKQNIKMFLLSLSYVTIPSIILSLGVGLINGRYISTFLVTFALIFILGILSNSWIQHLRVIRIGQLDYRMKDLENQQSVEVSCSACKERNIVPVKLRDRNTFNCKNCNKSNLIIFQFATALVTEPIIIPQIGANTNG